MKKRKILTLVILLVLLLIAIIIIAIYIKYRNNNTEIAYDNIQPYYCGGTRCLKKSSIAGTAISYGNCQICHKKMSFPNTNVDALCASCSAKTKRCKYCGEQLTDEQIARNKLKLSQTAKYNKINISDIKIAYIENTNYIACLCKNYDDDEEINPNEIVIIDMKDYSKVKTIKVNKNYKLEYEYNFDFMEEDLNENELFQYMQDEEKSKENYENLGRMFYNDKKLILINPEQEKSFIYNLDNEQFINDIDFKTGIYEGNTYYALEDKTEDITYYYFETYDLITTTFENIEWTNYVSDPYEFVPSDFYDAQIIYQDNEQILISYYVQEYGELKLKLFSKDGQNIDLSKINKNLTNNSQITISSKNMIVCYDIIKDCEIWSYDKNLSDKIFDELF